MSKKSQLEEQLNAYQDRLHALNLRAARFGYSTPAEISMEIKDIEADIRRLEAELANLDLDSNQEGGKVIKRFNLENIRILLISGFTDAELRRWCYDNHDLRPVYDQLSQLTGKASIVDTLIEYVERKNLFEILLALAQEDNPSRYQQHEPYFEFVNIEKSKPVEVPPPLEPIANAHPESSDPVTPFILPDDFTVLQIQAKTDVTSLSNADKKTFIQRVAAIVGVPANEIQICRQQEQWLALLIAKPAANQLVDWFDADDKSLRTLYDLFYIQRISLLDISGPQKMVANLDANHLALIRLLYLGAERVLIDREFGGGFGSTRVFLTQSIRLGGQPEASNIMKIGRQAEVAQEHVNTVDAIRYLPFLAAGAVAYVEFEKLAGMTASYVGGGRLEQPRSLEEYYETTPASDIINTLKGLLEKDLGSRWYSHNESYYCQFSQEYGKHLVEHIRLQLRPASADGIWLQSDAPAVDNWYDNSMTPEQIVTTHQTIAPDTLLQIEDVVVSKIKDHELKLEHRESGLIVKVEPLPAEHFSVGDRVTIRGTVRYNRHGRLIDIVQTVFDGYGVPVDVEADTLRLGNTPSPNPLQMYTNVLDKRLEGKASMVHGDLHLRNVLVDASGHAWLIDFARTGKRHTLYDFIKLETYIRQMVLSKPHYQFTYPQYLEFEQALINADVGHSLPALGDAALQKAAEVIYYIRQTAQRYMSDTSSLLNEYYPALFLYNLAMLKYYENHGKQAARLAFGTATVLAGAMTGDVSPPPEPKPNAMRIGIVVATVAVVLLLIAVSIGGFSVLQPSVEPPAPTSEATLNNLPAIEPGEPLRGRIITVGQERCYHYTASETTPVQITIQGVDTFGFIFAIRQNTVTMETVSSPLGNPQDLAFQPEINADYEFCIQSYDSQTGAYSISVVYITN